jgi:hypothetical protein
MPSILILFFKQRKDLGLNNGAFLWNFGTEIPYTIFAFAMRVPRPAHLNIPDLFTLTNYYAT